MIHYSDSAIVEGLRLDSDFIVHYLYREYFPTIRYLILNNSGHDEDAEDVFQEALLVILNRIKEEDFELRSSFLTYLYSVCRNIWLQRLKQDKVTERIKEDLLHFLKTPEVAKEAYIEYELKYDAFVRQFAHLSGDCQKLLKLFLSRMPLREIAVQMGYKSELYAKTKKHNCKEALKKLIENDPELQDML
jgi:RNA polymerase sigma factor (sigma-70 family)